MFSLEMRMPRLRSNESPSGAFKRQSGLAQARWRGLAPTSSGSFPTAVCPKPYQKKRPYHKGHNCKGAVRQKGHKHEVRCKSLSFQHGHRLRGAADPLGYADLILNGDPEEYLKNMAGSHGLEI